MVIQIEACAIVPPSQKAWCRSPSKEMVQSGNRLVKTFFGLLPHVLASSCCTAPDIFIRISHPDQASVMLKQIFSKGSRKPVVDGGGGPSDKC